MSRKPAAPLAPFAPNRFSNGMAKLSRVVSVVTFAAAAVGCLREPEPPNFRAVAQATNGVVAIATSRPNDPAGVTLCSGTVVAPNLVLTARHCVSHAVTARPACDAKGRSHNGDHLREDPKPTDVAVYVGPNVTVGKDVPKAHALRIIHPQGSVLCDADVAFVVLDRPLTGVTVLPMRLEGPIESGDSVVPIGFGGGRENRIGMRVPRGRSTVLAVGPGANAETGAVLGPHEFEVDSATCSGDSGGPALDLRSGEVVGVVSRGGSCSTSGNHVYTRVDAYARLAAVALGAAQKSARDNVASAR